MSAVFSAALIVNVCALVPCVVGAGGGQARTAPLDRTRYMGIDQIKTGMTGVGRTVLKGAELIEFKVTVVDVLRNWGPKQDAVLVRCAGANLEHTGIIMGMSGSPVYLRDPADGGKLKMIGAIAFGWRWHKDPVGGVTPIAQMLAIADSQGDPSAGARGGGGRGASRGPVRLPGEPAPSSPSRYAMLGYRAPVLDAATRRAGMTERDAVGDLQPLMTPLMVTGAAPSAMAYVREQLAGTRFRPVQMGGRGRAAVRGPDKLVPGASLVVPFLIGDVDMAAVGTVTDVLGDRVLGFGHSMMAEGPIELPMATGWVHTPIAMLSSSFKLGSMGKLAGTLVQDQESGIMGIVGRKAPMIPVTVTVTESGQKRTYGYEALHHRRMTPWVIASGLMMSVLADKDLPQEHTLRYRMSVGYENLGRFALSNVSSMRTLFDIRSDLTEPMSMLMDNQFGRARVRRVDVSVSVEPRASVAEMERAELIRSEFKPGETVEVDVRWRPYRADPFVRRYTLTLPADVPDGTYTLSVGSDRSHLMALRTEKPHLFRTESMADMMAAFGRIGSVRADRVYMRLSVGRGGLAVDKTEMPELPSFRRRIFGQAELHAVAGYAEPILAVHPVPFVVSGVKTFTIKVDRRADQ